MLRRSILEVWSHRPVIKIPTQITKQIPSYLSSRKQFSVASQKNAPKGSGATGKPSESGRNGSKVLVGGFLLSGAALMAYLNGYLDKYMVTEDRGSLDGKIGTVAENPQGLMENNQELKDGKHIEERIAQPNFQEPNILSPTVEHSQNNIEIDNLGKIEGENNSQEKVTSGLTLQKDITPVQENKLVSPQSTETSDNESINVATAVEESLHIKGQHEPIEITPLPAQTDADPIENKIESLPLHHLTPKAKLEDTLGNDVKEPSSLLDEYYLRDKTEESLYEHKTDLVGVVKDTDDAYISKDGTLIVDFLQAIHAAEKRQAELDAHKFGEEKRVMKEKYEKELKDARARELMYAEREAILDKELNKEKVKAAAVLKSVQEKLEEKLKMELEQKETEAELELKKTRELAEAELASAIASEKASQIEKMAEANLNINALCMAFYARSEEARKSHSVHKLALGALAIEEALSKGLPIKKEIDALHTYLEGIDNDSLLDLVLSSLPEETRNYGTDTVLQLNNKFDALKGTLRHFSLIPPGGGGILVHTLAHVASLLKIKEDDQAGDGIESLLNRVESYLADGKLLEAADTLEDGLKGSQAAEIVRDWVRQARNRAITEQALTLLQSFATSISLS